MFNRAMIETYLGNEDSVLQQLLRESEEHVKFVRKMIEKEFSHKTEETQNFLKKFSIESFEQLRPAIRDQMKQLQTQKSEIKRKEEVAAEKFLEKNNFSHLKLARPNMFEIVRSRALNMNNDDIQKLFKIKFDIVKLMRIIRGTFDSYWNMLNVYDGKRVTSFCEFAYIWIGSFSIDPEKCKIAEQPLCRLPLTQASNEADLERIRLILQLNNNFFTKHWECMTFADFINAKCTVDEIYFYLSCREMLNEGPCLSNRKNCFEIVQLENAKRVIPIVKKILARFSDRDTESILQRIMAQFIYKKSNLEMLDLAFVLKILLELYKADKRIRYDYLIKDLSLEKQFYDMLPNKHLGGPDHQHLTSYENFKKFLDKHFQFLSDTEKLELFCDAYNIGSGEITFDTMFIVLQEYGVFVKDLKIRQINLEVTYDTQSSLDISFYKAIKQNQAMDQKLGDILVSHVERLGIEHMAHEVKMYEGWLDGSRHVYGWKDNLMIYSKLMNIRCLVNSMSLFSSTAKLPQADFLSEMLDIQSQAYKSVFTLAAKVNETAKKEQNKINESATRLTRFQKNRLMKDNWYDLMSLILNFSQKNSNKITGNISPTQRYIHNKLEQESTAKRRLSQTSATKP
jgi:hypothetical protein